MTSPNGNEQKQWAVLGGGMLGLTLALELARDGHKVTIFEESDRLGGLADAWRLGDITWDRHYHVTLLSDTALRGLLNELGLEREMKWIPARTGFYSGGRLYSLSSSLEFLRFPPLRLIDKLRLAATILHASRVHDGRDLESVSVEDWLVAWSGRRTFEKIWLPLLRAKLGDSYKRASATFIWATIRRLYAARRQGLKQEMFGYVPGGYDRILRRLYEHLQEQGITICLGSAVREVEQNEKQGVRLKFLDHRQETFDSAVLTMPAPIAASLCPALSSTEKALLNNIEYQGIICASLLLRSPLASFYVTNITDDGLPFTGVIEMTTLVSPSEFNGHSLVYLPKYLAPDDPYFDLSDEDVRQRCIAGLERMYPKFRADDVLSFRVSRVRRVFALPTLNYSTRLPKVQTSIPGVYIVNSAHIVDGTLNVDETVRLAQRSIGLLQPTLNETYLQQAEASAYEAIR